MNDFALYSLLTFLTAGIAGLVPLFVHESKDNLLKLFVSLGAGVLLGMAIIHMVPESSELLPEGFGAWLLGGFVLLLILERFVMVHACDESGCHYHTLGLAAFAGLTLHGAIEGVGLASSLVASDIGPKVFLGIILHKAPAAITLSTLLKLSGKSSKAIIAFIFGIAVSTPVGILLGYFLLKSNEVPEFAGALLAMSAGTFLYIATCDLLPELHTGGKERTKRLAMFLLGLAICFLGD